MWALLSRRAQLSILVAMTIGVLLAYQGASEWWTGDTPSLPKTVSLVATLIGTVAVAIANWTWRALWRRFPVLNKVLFPDLNGVWEGTLQTTWMDPVTGKVPGPIPTRVTIRQGVLKVSIRQRTAESDSWSTKVIPEAEPDADRYRLWYTYTNKPKATVAHRSSDHDGVAWLEISLEDDPNELRGQYYTSRRTTGDLTLRRLGSLPISLPPAHSASA